MPKSKPILIELTGYITDVFWSKFAKLEGLYADNKELMNEKKELTTKIHRLEIEIVQLKNEIREPYSIDGMCKKLGISDTKLKEYRDNGLIDCCSVGQKVWFTEEHLQEFYRRTDSRFKVKLKKAE